MANFKDDNKTLVVATDDNEFFRSFLPPLETLPAALAGQVRSAYNVGGEITMMPFFDLLSLHELGHAFHLQGGLNVQRKWMGELFCNILLQTYIAENEPEQLAALTVFPNMVVAAGTEGYQFTSLQQLEKHYTQIAKEHPKNYGWYQSRWHVAARQIYDERGKEALPVLWNALKNQEPMTDEELISYFRANGNNAVSSMMINW